MWKKTRRPAPQRHRGTAPDWLPSLCLCVSVAHLLCVSVAPWLAGLDADTAVGRVQLDRRAAAVQAAFDVAPRFLRRLELEAGDADATVGAGGRDGRPR